MHGGYPADHANFINNNRGKIGKKSSPVGRNDLAGGLAAFHHAFKQGDQGFVVGAFGQQLAPMRRQHAHHLPGGGIIKHNIAFAVHHQHGVGAAGQDRGQAGAFLLNLLEQPGVFYGRRNLGRDQREGTPDIIANVFFFARSHVNDAGRPQPGQQGQTQQGNGFPRFGNRHVAVEYFGVSPFGGDIVVGQFPVGFQAGVDHFVCLVKFKRG